MTALFVYKCRDDPQSPYVAFGNWERRLADKRAFRWGAARTTANRHSLRLFEEVLDKGDLILAWQTDIQGAVGLCEVVGFEKKRQWMRLLWLERYSPPVPINELKRSSKKLQRVAAFKHGVVATLWETNDAEARVLLEACESKFAKKF